MHLGKKTVVIIGFISGVISVVAYLDTFMQLGIQGVLKKIVEAYHEMTKPLSYLFDPVLQFAITLIDECCRISVAFPQHWRDIFVPALFYLGRDATTNSRKRLHYGIFLWALAIPMALLASFSAGGDALVTSPQHSFALFVLWFVCYDIISFAYEATFIGYQDNTWWQTFSYHSKVRTLPAICLGVIVWLFLAYFSESLPYAGAVSLVGYVFLLGLRDVAVSLWVTWVHPIPDQGWRERLRSLGHWKIGSSTVAIIIAAVGAIIWSGL